MRRVMAGIAAASLAVILVFTIHAQAISAQSALVLDADTGRVLYEKDADRRSLIASTTKIMTALVVCEQCNVLDRVRIPKEAVGIEGSSIYLKEGEVLTVQDLLYGMMLHSGNDAAVALAIYCGGTVEGFAELMNDKARQLGMDSSNFSNPNGLDAPDHYATARDLATLAAYAMNNPIFRMTVSTKTVNAGNRSFRNHNKLLWQVDGADGVKTGFTKKAGRILVSSATRDNRRLIAVTINAPSDWSDHKKLLNDGFSGYTVRSLISKGDRLGQLEVSGGTEGIVTLLAGKDFSYPMAAGETFSLVLPKNEFVYAPVTQGACAGYAYGTINGNVVVKIPLIYGLTVEMETLKKPSFWDRLLRR